jgi:caa(3)-type oxidase subunit IV
MEFNDGYPSYETMAIHDEEHGKHVRKVIWKVFWIMLAITLVELYIGFKVADWHLTGTFTIKFIFITLTIVKAAYIVLSFMHLGDEDKSFRYIVLIPFCVFVIYLVTLVDISEGTYSKAGRYGLDENVIKQKQDQLNNKSSHDTDHKSQSH